MKNRRSLVLIGLTVFIVYLNSFQGVFQFDDYNVIVNNPVIHSWSSWFSDVSHGIRPALKFTYMLNWTSGMGVFGFHLFNLTIHMANAFLFYFIVLKFTEHTSSQVSPVLSENTALWAALLFALHPVQTEAVTYISGRSSSLMSLFYLGSILAYDKGTQAHKSLWRTIISPLLFLISLLTKEVAVTLPFALILWERVCRPERTWKDILREQAVHWLLFSGICIIILAHPGYSRLLETGIQARGLSENLYSQINAVLYLLSRLFLVNRLNIDPDVPVITSWSPMLAMEGLLLGTMLFAGLLSMKKKPWLGFGIIWFFLHLIPTNSVVPRLDVANERQLYLASSGLFLIFATAGVRFHTTLRQRQAGAVVASLAIVLLATLGCFTVERNQNYGSEIAMWMDVTLKSPNKARGYNNLGYALAAAGRTEEAKKAYTTALVLRPDYALARANLESISGLQPLLHQSK